MTAEPTAAPHPTTSSPPSLVGPALVTTRAAMWDARWRLTGRVAVVPTMGALHDGHVALIRAARRAADAVVVTIFVNPLQFGVGEDLARYPRNLQADLALCAEEGVDVVFAPPVEEIYPNGDPAVRVVAGPLGGRFEGSSRPGHFDGVLTVVLKLFHLCQPQVAVFGEKDAQQLFLVQQMVADLDLPVQVLAVPIQREADGVALSSRNRYLDVQHRHSAAALHRALLAGATAGPGGSSAVLNAARDELLAESGVRLDYLRLVTPGFEDAPVAQQGPALLLVAAYVGSTRLIDNIAVTLGPSGPR